MMALSKELIESSDFATKREAYYISKNWEECKFDEQTESDTVMDDIEALFSVDHVAREQLRFYPEEHGGSVSGPLTVIDRDAWNTIDELAKLLLPHAPLTLAAATDGNHGRAVARMARLLGLGALIYVPYDMALARIEAIKSEGAEVVVVEGYYDDAIALAADAASADTLVISDTSWEGYEDVPAKVI